MLVLVLVVLLLQLVLVARVVADACVVRCSEPCIFWSQPSLIAMSPSPDLRNELPPVLRIFTIPHATIDNKAAAHMKMFFWVADGLNVAELELLNGGH